MTQKAKQYFLLLLIASIGLAFSTASKASWFGDIFQKSHSSNASIEQRVNELSGQTNIDPKVLRLALIAFKNAKQRGIDTKNIITIIDYSKPSTAKRLWVIDLRRNTVAFNTFVAHGQRSGNNTTTSFSNSSGSHASSLGVFLTGNTYVGGNGYSLTLHGLEKEFNDHAFERRVVFHGAAYVNEAIARRYGRIGRSWGCPALDQRIAPKIIDYIKRGTLVFAYYPDRRWLNRSLFLN